MIPHPFRYHRAGSLAEAQSLLQGEAKLLAGGQSLIPAMKTRLAAPSDLIDISHLSELSFVRAEKEALAVGAGATHHVVSTHADVVRLLPALGLLARDIGDPAVRYRGTLGGSLANNDPAADYPAAVLALDATIRTTKRQIAAEDFFLGMFATALEEDEIILEVRFPVPQKAAYAKFRNPASRYALAGVFVAQHADGVRVAVTGAGACVLRLPAMEQALDRHFHPSALEGIAVDQDLLQSDLHASAEYRAQLVKVMAHRAVKAAVETGP
jgi:carbon-monoxide dehydrogenase medium subunit